MSDLNPPAATTGNAPAQETTAPPRRSRKRLVVKVSAGIAALAVIACAAVYAVYLYRTHHTLSVPRTAGGLTRDTAAESRAAAQIKWQRDLIKRVSDREISGFKSAVYGNGDLRFLFVGGTGDFDTDQLDFQFAYSVALGNGSYKYFDFPSGPRGDDGPGRCADVQTRQGAFGTTVICGWATRTTVATVTPLPNTDKPLPLEPEHHGNGRIDQKYEADVVDHYMHMIRADVED